MTHIASAVALLACAYCLSRAAHNLDRGRVVLCAAWGGAAVLCVVGACVVWEVWK